MSNNEVKKRPVWKNILRWVLIVSAVLVLVDAAMSLFVFFTAGVNISWAQFTGWVVALIILMKLGIIKYEKGRWIK